LLSALVTLLILPLAVGPVPQLLLPANHVAKIVQHRHVVGVLAVLRTRHLKVLHHLRKRIEHLPGGITVAWLRHLLKAIKHALEILRSQLLRVGIERARRHVRILFHLLGERLDELVHGRAQLVHQPLEFLVAGAAVEGVAQCLLGILKTRRRVGHVALLKHGRVGPHLLDHLAQSVVAVGLRQLPEQRPQAEIVAELRHELVRGHGERVEGDQHPVAVSGVEGELAPLLDDGTGELLGKRTLGQAEGVRRAGPHVVGFVAGRERHDDLGAGPGVIAQVLRGLAGAVADPRLRQR
jgi:hypothetical protein